VLVGTPGRSDPGTARNVVGSLETDYDHVMNLYWDKLLTDARPETAQTIRSRSRTIPRDVSLAIIRAIFAYDPLPALRTYPGPVLLVDTTRDQGPGSLHQQMPLIRQEVVSGSSHWIQLDRPREFDGILDRFLSGLAPPKR
jgi:pimeloyl-ACP methyl ester carboxylesterase